MSGATKILMGAAGVDTGPSDDEFDNVSFLSHFDGSNNGTNIVYDDGSAGNHTVTVTNDPTQGTFSPFSRVDGEWSNYFAGDSNYLEIASSSDFNFGTGDFTWEWFFFGAPSVEYCVFYSQTGADFGVYYYPPTGKIYYDNDAISDTDMGTLPLNSWNHIAVSRVSGTSNLYLNGTRTATVSDGQDYATGTARVGNYRTGSGSTYPMKGYISNLRIIKGTGLYSASSITVPTSALTAISGTVLLTCQSNRFKDNSASAHTLTAAGTPRVSAFTPILTSKVYDSAVNGASVFFSGAGSSESEMLSIDASGDSDSDFYFGTGDFTVEGWLYPSQNDTSYRWFYGAGNMWQMYVRSSVIDVYLAYSEGTYATRVLTGSIACIAGQWHHWAVTREAGAFSFFLDGVRGLANTGVTGSFEAPSGGTYKDDINIGEYKTAGTYPFYGYMSDIRVLKGTALYDPTSSTCTVPTAPLTAITNTKLLLNMADGQAIDSAAQNNVTLYGTADTSTTQKKFGTSSLFLEGDSDTDFAQLHGVRDLSGPFTIECWARAADTDNAWLWCNGQYTIELGINGDDLRIGTPGYTNFFTSGEFTVNTWHHVALVRDTSNVIKCYLNGTASGTTLTSSTAFVATSGIFIIGGEWRSSTQIYHGWDGYVDEFRISRFARYTSNFTPSTEAFPDKGQ